MESRPILNIGMILTTNSCFEVYDLGLVDPKSFPHLVEEVVVVPLVLLRLETSENGGD
jgi:hypothetical protein